MLKQRSQKTTWSRTAIRAAASVRASASGARSRWKVSRWAVFGPIPGRRANASMTAFVMQSRLQPRDPQAAGDRGHLLFGDLARSAQGVVDRRDDQVLEHVDVA